MIILKSIRRPVLAMIAIGLLLGSALAAQPKRVLILPLAIHADKDVSFLQGGIRSMLSSRLYQPGKTEIIGQEETLQAVKAHGADVTTDAAAVALAKQLKADYAVVGSLMMMGETISTDVRMVDVDQGKPVAAVNQVGKTQGAVIEHIDMFCTLVNADVFGRQAQIRQPAPQAKAQAKAEAVDERRMHPEKLMSSDVREDTAGVRIQPGMAAAGAWRIGRQFKAQLRGLAVGDVNGDGRSDVAVIDTSTLKVFQYEQGRLLPLGTVEGNKASSFISVDIADINGNGVAEIFITNRPLFRGGHPESRAFAASTPQLRSFVVEWDGKRFNKIVEDDRRFFRVLHIPHRGPVLLGQRHGNISNTFGENSIFRGSVSELVWRGGAYVEEGGLGLPARLNLYNFALGDIDSNGQEMILTYSQQDDYLRLLDRGGAERWQSAEPFGTTDTYLEIPDQGDMTDMDRYYLPSRIIVTAPAQDGGPSVLVVKNSESARTFPRVKMFKSGHIEYLTWNGLSFVPTWRTQPVSKYISDFALGDLNGDGKDELVFAVVVQTASAFEDGKSTIVFQDLPDFSKPTQQ